RRTYRRVAGRSVDPTRTPRRGSPSACGTRRVACTTAASLPGDAVVLAEVARTAPERAVHGVEHDRVDRAGGLLGRLDAIAHSVELRHDPHGRVGAHEQAPGIGRVEAERLVHLVAVDVRGLDGLLHV